MAKACKSVDVDIARGQAARLLKQAETKIGTQSRCQLQLQTARSAFAAVDSLGETGLERRNSYIRATFHAGQALACAAIEQIVPTAISKKRKAKAAKAVAKVQAAEAVTPTKMVPSIKPKRVRKPKMVAS